MDLRNVVGFLLHENNSLTDEIIDKIICHKGVFYEIY